MKTTRITAFIAALLMILTLPHFSLTSFAARRMGDLDGDGSIVAAEYLKIKRAVLQTYDLTDNERLAADVSGNGEIDAADYLMVKRDVLGSYAIVSCVEYSEGLQYFLKNDGYYVTGIGTCTDADIAIPPVYNGLPVTGIDSYAFSHVGDFDFDGGSEEPGPPYAGTSITVPESVRYIGFHAFEGCTELVKINLPRGIETIGTDAFYGTGYYNDENNWKNGVLYIGNYLIEAKKDISGSVSVRVGTVGLADRAFFNCASLESVIIPDSVKFIAEAAFAGCSSLAEAIIGQGVTGIGYGAFMGCSSLESITLPAGITVIPERLFYDCSSLSEIVLEGELTSIGETAFRNTAYFNDADNCEDGVLYIGNNLIHADKDVLPGSYEINDGTVLIADGAFTDCEKTVSVTIPDGLRVIGKKSFYNCGSLLAVEIPDSVTRIGESAFERCYELKSAILPSHIDRIEKSVFSWCTELKSIDIPDSVTRIGDSAFSDCLKLENVTFGSGVKSIGSHAFCRCKLESVEIPSGVEYIYGGAFASCHDLKSAVIPSGVTYIGNGVFEHCSTLESVTVGAGVAHIGKHAFSDCRALAGVTFADANGWTVSLYDPSRDPAAVAASDISDPASAAALLTDTYLEYYWFKN
ncbi:MAG: leucine-rich repeat protein [Clostridia bacterium]|nr:leucine-rich repeat protein [Clostridia bacterium]